MTSLLEQLGSELSFIRAGNLSCDWNDALHYCRTTLINKDAHYEPTPDDHLLYDILTKTLQRGRRPFTSYFTERLIVKHYGTPFGLKENTSDGTGSIRYTFDQGLIQAYRNFTDILDPWQGQIDQIEFDPQHPENERKLFARLLERFGSRIAHCIEPQAQIDTILKAKEASGFLSQRADFLLSFPNGRGILLEPGDHDDPRQIALDKMRDAAFSQLNISTLRPRNSDISSKCLYDQIETHLNKHNMARFLKKAPNKRSRTELSCNYLFLLPSLITRIERLLVHFWFREGLAHLPQLRIGILERDLMCAELGVASFLDRLKRTCQLYGIENQKPNIQLFVQRNPAYRQEPLSWLTLPVEQCLSFEELSLDLILDVGIKCNSLTPPELMGAPYAGAVRQVYAHNQPVRFCYQSRIRPVHINLETDALLNTFVRDFFRKHNLRPGQGPILHNILSQKSTIGLLPTSAGKSLCYQLASLLTPGTTFIVDPIVALMNDQVQGLADQYGIDRVLALHANSNLHDQQVSVILSERLMVFMSPERFQRPEFRQSMRALNAADIYINYAVIDEAHCVSMWGHDFRPSYLTLEHNFHQYCSFQGRSPVLVALTGTASQLVLIDLKRTLNIQDMDAIIRPDTFDRPELRFNLVTCTNNGKKEMLKQVMATVARRLNVQSLDMDAHGIIFGHTCDELWELFGDYVGDAKGYVNTVIKDGNRHGLRYGVYTGSPPPKSGLSRKEWEEYKTRTLRAFKCGDIQMLFGNMAISVGIDNEKLNYVINLRMPPSLEAYYQQCGRAGRSGQRSECYLIFSDDAPKNTQLWLNREVPKMPKRWDDLGTVAYFHEGNFPGPTHDCNAANAIFRLLFKNTDQQGLIPIPAYPDPKTTKEQAERMEHYLSYWLILGVLVDYEVTGMEQTTVYHVRRHEVIDRFLTERNETALKSHLVDNLHNYLSRYRPTSCTEVEKGLSARPETVLSKQSIGYLIDFMYSQIEYQRREAVRTMVSFCNQTDTSPERLRKIIQAYFDRSEKFSEGLLVMADAAPDFTLVAAILERIEGFDDVEHLYWESRRLLDERFRADWAAVNLFAVTYREKGVVSDQFYRICDDILEALTNVHGLDDQTAFRFLAMFLSYLTRLDTVFGESISVEMQVECAARFYQKIGLGYVHIIDQMTIPESNRQFIQLQIANLQLKEMLDAQYSRVIR